MAAPACGPGVDVAADFTSSWSGEGPIEFVRGAVRGAVLTDRDDRFEVMRDPAQLLDVHAGQGT